MAIPGQNIPNVNQSNDSGDYVASFCSNVLFLLVAGYERLVADGIDYSDTAEEHITGELTQQTEQYSTVHQQARLTLLDQGLCCTRGTARECARKKRQA